MKEYSTAMAVNDHLGEVKSHAGTVRTLGAGIVGPEKLGEQFCLLTDRHAYAMVLHLQPYRPR